MSRTLRSSTLLLALLAAAACSHAPAPLPFPVGGAEAQAPAAPSRPPAAASDPPGAAPPPVDDGARVQAIRAEVDAYLKAQATALWDAWTKGKAPELEPSVSRHQALFSRDTLDLVKRARDAAKGDERRALSLLHGFLTGEYLARAVAAVPGQPVAEAVVTWDARSLPVPRVRSALAGEADPRRRAALERAWLEAEQRAEPGRRARWDAIARAAARLGYPSLLALAAELRGASAEELSALADEVLSTTEAGYRAAVGALARSQSGRALADLRGRDLPRLLRGADDALDFPGARAAGEVRDTLSDLGLDLASRPGAVLDLEPRPGKDPRALTLPVEVPGSVRVSFAPQGGHAELAALLHEMGAAAYFSRVASPSVELRRLGAVTAETWANLFEDLAGDPGWLKARTAVPDNHVGDVVRLAAARRLHRARTLAARILVEVARARDRQAPGAKAILERAFLHPVDPEELELFLLDRDGLLQSADELRAVLIASQADRFLSDRAAGRPWWRAGESGGWLATAFAEGSRLAPPELARSVGAARVDAAALAASSAARLRSAGVDPEPAKVAAHR